MSIHSSDRLTYSFKCIKEEIEKNIRESKISSVNLKPFRIKDKEEQTYMLTVGKEYNSTVIKVMYKKFKTSEVKSKGFIYDYQLNTLIDDFNPIANIKDQLYKCKDTA